MKQSSLDESLGIDFEQSDDEMREFDDQQAMEDSGEIPQPPSPRPSTPVPAKGKSTLLYIFNYLINFNQLKCYCCINRTCFQRKYA